MGRLTEADTFKAWTTTAAVVGTTGAATLLSVLVPASLTRPPQAP